MSETGTSRSYVLTPPGGGAIAVLRIFGMDAPAIMAKLFRPASPNRSADGPSITSRPVEPCFFDDDHLRYGEIVVGDEVIDSGLVSCAWLTPPQAYDVCVHGGVRIVERLLDHLGRLGAPIAGEDECPPAAWSARNLIELEADAALAYAKTERVVRFLARQRRQLPPALDQLASRCRHDPPGVRAELEAIHAGYPVARRLIDGVTVVIVGPSNSGKSTLFNRLVGRSTTLVSPVAGTTRDWVTASVDLDGVPITLVDTAGDCEGAGALEAVAIGRGRELARRADMRLCVLDGSRPSSILAGGEDLRCDSQTRCLTVFNKCDLASVPQPDGLSGSETVGTECPIRISASTGVGFARLTQAILRVLGLAARPDTRPALFSARQREVGEKALSDLTADPAFAEATIRQQLVGGPSSVGSDPVRV